MAYKGEGPLKDWLEDLYDLEQTVTSCDTDAKDGVSIQVKPSQAVDNEMVRDSHTIQLGSKDLEFAVGDSGRHIWPALLRKTIEAIQKNYDGSKTLLRDTDGNAANCKTKGLNENQRWKQQYLCVVSDLVTRLTNTRLETSEVANKEFKFATLLTKLLKGDKPVIVFDKWAPRYLVDSMDLLSYSKDVQPDEQKPDTTNLLSDLKDLNLDLENIPSIDLPSYFKDIKLDVEKFDTTGLLPSFKAFKLDVEKKGSSKEIFYQFTGNGEENYQLGKEEILRSRRSDERVRFVYPA